VTRSDPRRRDLLRRGAALGATLLALGAGCITPPGAQRREELLIQNARAFNDDWRWARWDTMAGVMPKDDAAAFLARAQALEPELVVADFEVTSINFLEESKAAKVIAKFDWYLKRDPRVRTTTVEQRWENSDGRWQVVKLRRTRGDRFGLVTEPASTDPTATDPTAAPGGTPAPAPTP
jgi:hypothetical protein